MGSQRAFRSRNARKSGLNECVAPVRRFKKRAAIRRAGLPLTSQKGRRQNRVMPRARPSLRAARRASDEYSRWGKGRLDATFAKRASQWRSVSRRLPRDHADRAVASPFVPAAETKRFRFVCATSRREEMSDRDRGSRRLQEGWTPLEKAMKPMKALQQPQVAPKKPADSKAAANPPKRD